jgi:hypothetical protein
MGIGLDKWLIIFSACYSPVFCLPEYVGNFFITSIKDIRKTNLRKKIKMGHFTIILPNNREGDVRWGTVRKKMSFMNLFQKNKIKDEVRKGYIVRIESVKTGQKTYRLLKTKEGQWISENIPGFSVAYDNEESQAIKKAIDEFESRH